LEFRRTQFAATVPRPRRRPGVSHVHRLRVSDRIFFVTVSLRRTLAPLASNEYGHVAAAIEESRRKLGFNLLGYVLMPDHWHALIWTRYPLTISQVIHDIKKVAARRCDERTGQFLIAPTTSGAAPKAPFGNISFGTASCAMRRNWATDCNICT